MLLASEKFDVDWIEMILLEVLMELKKKRKRCLSDAK